MIFFDKGSIFLGEGIFFYKLTKNPDLTFFFFFGGGGGGGKCTYMYKCFKWHFDSSRRTPVQNYFEIHAYI